MAPRGNGLYIPAWVFAGEASALGEGVPECLLADEGGGLLMFVECELI